MLNRVSLPTGRKAALPVSSTRRLASFPRYLMTVLRMVLVWFGVSFWAKELVLPIQNVMAMIVRRRIFMEFLTNGVRFRVRFLTE